MYKINPYGGVILNQIKFIPEDLANKDWVEYQEWLAQGNIPIPADPPGPEDFFNNK
jgi:hypothetical protein